MKEPAMTIPKQDLFHIIDRSVSSELTARKLTIIDAAGHPMDTNEAATRERPGSVVLTGHQFREFVGEALRRSWSAFHVIDEGGRCLADAEREDLVLAIVQTAALTAVAINNSTIPGRTPS
jgi:hypothetical protein